jgi:hypothetical protein
MHVSVYRVEMIYLPGKKYYSGATQVTGSVSMTLFCLSLELRIW